MYQDTDFLPTRAAGLERLRSFLPRMGRSYATGRNHDHGPDSRDNVSGLSPYVRHRLVTEAEVLSTALAGHGLVKAEKFVQEVFWRTYWKGWLEMRPRVWQDYLDGSDGVRHRLDGDVDLAALHRSALSGITGIDCFDAWVQELRQTGYLHNHTRMWFASIWIFTLKLPWELGADFFMRHLLDGDPASNTLSWRWVAGLQTRGKHYLARAANIREFTGGRFDPAGLVPFADPLDGPPPPPPMALPEPDTPDPDLRTGLLLHEDDLNPESLDLPISVDSVALGRLGAVHTPAGVDDGVSAWVDSALRDTAERACNHFACETVIIPAGEWMAGVLEWVADYGVQQVVTPYAPVGAVQDALTDLDTTLARRGVPLVRLLRPYDRACWPHAGRGFFSFKEKIPGLIRTLSLDAPVTHAAD